MFSTLSKIDTYVERYAGYPLMFINQVDHESKPRENDERFRILKTHNDDEDYGMASMCYFGNYGGGYLVLPDLHTTIIARPGDIVLICANKIFNWSAYRSVDTLLLSILRSVSSR